MLPRSFPLQTKPIHSILHVSLWFSSETVSSISKMANDYVPLLKGRTQLT